MSEDLNRDLLIALKALLYVNDHSSRMSYAVIDPVDGFVRDVIERAELRPSSKGVIRHNSIPEGWYDDVKNNASPSPLALLAAAHEANGNHPILTSFRLPEVDLEDYISKTALAPAPATPSSPRP